MAPTESQPLSVLLSQVLVAFTIEFDNEAEHRVPHRTTAHGATSGSLYSPWLVSMAMWFNCMRFVTEEGISVRELERSARTPTNLAGMQRWGYITVGPDPSDRRPKPPKSSWQIRATTGGMRAREVWEPLLAEIEQRWKQRFSAGILDRLKSRLEELAGQLDPDLPDSMPILGYGLKVADRLTRLPSVVPTPPQPRWIPALLARALTAFALDFEREADIALAIYANLLRLVDQDGVRMRDLPILSGVSKESLSMAMGILRKRGWVVDPSGTSGKVVRLTAAGVASQKSHRALLARTESTWSARFGAEALLQLREIVAELVGDGTPSSSPLFKGLEPYPEGWRASARTPSTLPHFPMVLHRGGFPDGS